MDIQKRIQEDLAKSGLTISDMAVRDLDNSVKAATSVSASAHGYVIPYFGIRGQPIAFYRVKLFDLEPKYKQPKDTPNHVYFPKGFLDLAMRMPYVIITEGEKKAAAAVKAGFPTVAIGGVESWRNRLFSIPVDSELNTEKGKVNAKIPSGSEVTENFMSPLAMGLQDLIDFCLHHQKHLIIIYDADGKELTNHKVQAAAATLGYELRFRGLPYTHIRQVRLPPLPEIDKVGLDDFIELAPKQALIALIEGCIAKRSAFPRHPNVRDYVNKRLQKAKMSRKEMQQVSMAILSELDSTGMRLRSDQELQTYYFDDKTHKLLKATFGGNANELTDNPFGHYLYRTFGIGAADQRLVQWLGTQFTGEEPVENVTPHRVLARINNAAYKDSIIYQISDGQYVTINGNSRGDTDPTPGFAIHNNGANGVLFESEQVKPLDPELLRDEYAKCCKTRITPYWSDVLTQVRLKDRNVQQKTLAALLFYVAPWLNRWRGTQLPIEMTLGEAGSGKSTLQELRLDILTGIPKLRNAPQDWKDWAASVTSTGALHIIDNLQLGDKNFRNRLSDEICRIITEPEPTIEMRKYYTNADLMYLPVNCQFGITAIKQPFLNSDVLARAVIIELDKSQDLVNGSLSYDASWKSNQMSRFGGREAWVAHHLYALHKFFELVKVQWNNKYQAKHRLINLEQSLRIMAEVFGIPSDWIPDYLNNSTNSAVRDADWAFEGIIQWSITMREHKANPSQSYTAQDISAWAASTEEYMECDELTNSRRLGRYLQTHKTIIQSTTGLKESGKSNNRTKYILVARKDVPPSF